MIHLLSNQYFNVKQKEKISRITYGRFGKRYREFGLCRHFNASFCFLIVVLKIKMKHA